MTKEERKVYMKEYRETYISPETKEERALRNKKYRAKVKALTSERNKAYNRANPGVVSAGAARRRARLKTAEVTLDDIDNNIISNLYAIRAGLSKANGVEYHVDHRKPIAKGGKHHWMNLQIITAQANLAKSDTYPYG